MKLPAKKTSRQLLLLLCSCLLLPLSIWAAGDTPEELLRQEPVSIKPSSPERLVAKIVVDLIAHFHYEPRMVDPAISSQWFQEYFKTLDANRMIFLESDIENFRSFETVLWNSRNRLPNLDFAFGVYELYLRRSREWALYSIECLKMTHDFSVEEFLPIDSREEPWCKNMDELQDLWRRRVKNALLNEEIIAAKEKEKEKKKEKTANAVVQDSQAPLGETAVVAKELPVPSIDPPEQRLARNFARNYKRRAELEAIDILELFLSSLTRVYDPHSAYMAPETKENFDINMRLSLQGIGAVLTSQDSYTTVVSIIPGGPADKDGHLKSGDRIIAVAQDGEDAVDVVEMPLNKVVSQIRGAKGSVVHLTILPEGSGTPQRLSLLRDEVKLTDQEAQSEVRQLPLDSGRTGQVLVVFLPSFYADFAAKGAGDDNYKSSTRDISALMREASQNKQLDGMILDLRGNGGGSLEEAIELSGLFLAEGPVVQVRNNKGQVEQRVVPNNKAEYEGPLLVLVDKFSASASEIVAAALQDRGRALVVGDRSTHGKGTVQTIFDLRRIQSISRAKKQFGEQEPGSLKFTMAKFYRVNGSSTQVKGMTPDIFFPSFTDHMETGESNLPHVLPWDVIEAAKYRPLAGLGALLPSLREAALKRAQDDALFQEYLEDIAFYAQLRAMKNLPLERGAREAFQAREEKASKMIRKFQARRKNSSRRGGEQAAASEDDAAGQDLLLEAALGVMGDLLRELSPLTLTAEQHAPLTLPTAAE
jgi:carboxyl-terminal processing protease